MVHLRIFVVDDEFLVRWSLKEDLSNRGYEVIEAENGEDALQKLRHTPPDLVLLDIRLPGMDGLKVLQEIKSFNNEIVVIMMTAFGDVETAVKAMKIGAYDYITKPFDLDEVAQTVKMSLEKTALKKEIEQLREQLKEKHGFGNIIGKSPAMQEVFEMVKRIAESDATTVLLQGESGTGKDLVARTIHYQSTRFNKPFVEVNCAAIPETLLESELMGYEKGAFTDAKASKAGLLEQAHGGTLFLDEIGEMRLDMQVKLLKVIETKRFRRVGGVKDIEVDTRFIAATNRDLWVAVQEGHFREDLYYRLKIFPIYIPPLRERKSDIPLLIRFFINKFNQEFKKTIKGVTPEAELLLCRYAWPGNVRELKNVVERAIILGNGEMISPEYLPREIIHSIESEEGKEMEIILPDIGASLEGVEKELIRQALEKCGWNQSQAARLLSISRDTLRYRMKKFGFLE